MTYGDAAKQLVIKVIGTVESGLDYSAINYNDPITVGIAQWFGTRAANILCRMRDENPSSWNGVAASIAGELASIDRADTYWNTKRLTQTEGESLRPVIGNNRSIQDDQTIVDMEVYKGVAVNKGINPDTNTKTMLYFFTMYHQGPVYAFQVLDDVGPNASLLQIHSACLTNPVLGQYSNRYNEAYALINEGSVDDGTTPTDPGDGGTTTPPPTTAGKVRHASIRDRLMHVTLGDGTKATLYRTTNGLYVAKRGATAPPVDPEDPDNPTDPTDPTDPPTGGAWTHPLPGATFTSPYGPRGDGINDGIHYGADLSTGVGQIGQPVLAPTEIRITVAAYGNPNDFHFGTAGNHVKGHATDGSYTFNFFHLYEISCSVGDVIARGARVGIEGATGNVTGLHLHLETHPGIQQNPGTPPYGNPVDPEPIFAAKGVTF